MSDLVEFLRARLAEDEKAAEAASGLEWGDIEPMQPFVVFDVEAHRNRKTQTTVGAIASVSRAEDRAHIARHDPARVLAEVAAKRGMLALHAPNERAGDECVICDQGTDSCGCMGMNGGWPCETLQLLALPYASHPDYRPEWAPTA